MNVMQGFILTFNDLNVNDIAASEDILERLSCIKPFSGKYNCILYYVGSLFYIIYIEKIQVRSALFRGPGLV